MLRLKKTYKVLTIFSIVILMIAGCSNPQSQKEAQKLRQETELLQPDKPAHTESKRLQSMSDSLITNESKENIQKNQPVRANQVSDSDSIQMNQIDELKIKIADLERQLEQIKDRLLDVEQKNKMLNQKKDSTQTSDSYKKEQIDIPKKINQDTEKKQGEELLKILEANKNTEQNRADTSVHTTAVTDSNQLETVKTLSKNKSEENGPETESEIEKQKSDRNKQLISDSTKAGQEQLKKKQDKSKAVDSTTKIVTIILAIALVLFVFLYMVGKRGLAKKQSRKKQ